MFFGWKVVAVAFTVATFTWGIGLYGLSVFVSEIERTRGWSVTQVSAAVTWNMLVGAVVLANVPTLHARFGVARATQAGAVLTAIGLIGWALAAEQWELFVVAPFSGAGWALSSGAAMNAMVSPWFDQRRLAALSMAYNGTGVGGIIFPPLLVFLIARYGLPAAAVIVGIVTTSVVIWLSARYLTLTPADLGLKVDDGINLTGSVPAGTALPPPLPRSGAWRDRRLITQAAATAMGLSAQIGLVMQLFSVLVPSLGHRGASTVISLMTLATLIGRGLLALVMRLETNRRLAAVVNNGIQVLGSVALLLSGAQNIPLLLVGVLLFGLGSGNLASLPPLIAQREFPQADVQRAVALVLGFSQACFAFAPLAFGSLRGLADDGSVTQATTVFLAAGLLQLGSVGALLAGITRRTPAAVANPM